MVWVDLCSLSATLLCECAWQTIKRKAATFSMILTYRLLSLNVCLMNSLQGCTRITLRTWRQTQLNGQCVYLGYCLNDPVSRTASVGTNVPHRTGCRAFDHRTLQLVHNLIESVGQTHHYLFTFGPPLARPCRIACRGCNPLTFVPVNARWRTLLLCEVNYYRWDIIEVKHSDIVIFWRVHSASMPKLTRSSCPREEVIQFGIVRGSTLLEFEIFVRPVLLQNMVTEVVKLW